MDAYHAYKDSGVKWIGEIPSHWALKRLSRVEWEKNKVVYEINFTKYFYAYKPLRSLQEITSDLMKLEEESENLMSQIVE